MLREPSCKAPIARAHTLACALLARRAVIKRSPKKPLRLSRELIRELALGTLRAPGALDIVTKQQWCTAAWTCRVDDTM